MDRATAVADYRVALEALKLLAIAEPTNADLGRRIELITAKLAPTRARR